jgi:hypothetical protein
MGNEARSCQYHYGEMAGRRYQQVKRIVIIGVLAIVMFILASCAPSQTTKLEAFPKMYSERPSVILVVPPINETMTAADAKEYYSTTIEHAIWEISSCVCEGWQ